MEHILFRGTSHLAIVAELRRQQLLREACQRALEVEARATRRPSSPGLVARIATLISGMPDRLLRRTPDDLKIAVD